MTFFRSSQDDGGVPKEVFKSVQKTNQGRRQSSTLRSQRGGPGHEGVGQPAGAALYFAHVF